MAYHAASMAEPARATPHSLASVAVLVAVTMAACRPVPPPPLVPLLAGTEPERRDAVAAMLILGVVHAGDSLFSGAGGLGLAVRVEHQRTDHTAIGLQLGGGRGEEGGSGEHPPPRRTLIAFEAFGRSNLADWTAVTYGAGLSWFSTGLVSLGAHAGLAVSLPNDIAVPYAQLGVAGVVPIVPGDPFGRVDNPGGGPCLGCMHRGNAAPLTTTGPRPAAELFGLASIGVVVGVTDRNARSLDLGLAHAPGQTIGALSIAGARRYDPRVELSPTGP